jgi:hypothetical protein
MCTKANLQISNVHSDATTASTDTTYTAVDTANGGIYVHEASRECVESLPRYKG